MISLLQTAPWAMTILHNGLEQTWGKSTCLDLKYFIL